ncbi:hypothetical protein H0H87_011544, partial [Tephrocybe sp. NHM501043]
LVSMPSREAGGPPARICATPTAHLIADMTCTLYPPTTPVPSPTFNPSASASRIANASDEKYAFDNGQCATAVLRSLRPVDLLFGAKHVLVKPLHKWELKAGSLVEKLRGA